MRLDVPHPRLNELDFSPVDPTSDVMLDKQRNPNLGLNTFCPCTKRPDNHVTLITQS